MDWRAEFRAADGLLVIHGLKGEKLEGMVRFASLVDGGDESAAANPLIDDVGLEIEATPSG